MSDRPILFSGEMVRAILDGRKTQTRRIVCPRQTEPKVPPLRMEPWVIDGERQEYDDGRPLWSGFHPRYPGEAKWFACDYGQPGDRLWVRETFRSFSAGHLKDHDSAYPVHQHYAHHPETITIYRETGAKFPEHFYRDGMAKWTSPIHMHRYESRLTLEITGVRVERLRQITVIDALAEGVKTMWEFIDIWDRINGKRATYASNPWVWVIEFKQVRP